MLLTLVSNPLRRPIGDPHANSSKASLELSFRTGAPTDGMPSGMGQHVFRRYRENIRDVPLSGTTALGNRPDHLQLSRVDLEVPRNPDGTGQLACCESLAEWSAHPIAGVREHAAKPYTGRDGTLNLRQSQLRLRACRSIFGRNTCAFQPSPIARPLSGRKNRNASITRTYPRASV